MHLIDIVHRLNFLVSLPFVFDSLFRCVSQYTVSADPSKFLIRSKDLLHVEVRRTDV